MSLTLTLRPSGSTTVSGTVSLVGAASAHVALDSPDSDASYVTFDSADYMVFDMDNPSSLPLDAFITSIVPRVRYVNTYLSSVFLLSGSWQAVQYLPKKTTIGTVSLSSIPTKSNGPWTPADLDVLQIGIDTFIDSATTTIYELYLDVLYERPLVPTGTTPNGSSYDTTRPTFKWTNSDPSSAGQYAYQVWVYDSDTYLQPGFTPFDSDFDPVVKSGTVISTLKEYTPNVDLELGKSYRAYIKVASQQGMSRNIWSSVGPYAYVTLNASAPAAPRITVSDVIDDSVGIEIWGEDNILGQNDAEFTSGVGFWVNVSGLILAQEATANILGALRALKLTTTGVGNVSYAMPFGTYAVEEGEEYTFLTYMRGAATTRNFRSTLKFYTTGGSLLGTTVGPQSKGSTGTYSGGYVTATAPIGATRVRIEVEILAAAGAGEIFYCGGCKLVKGVASLTRTSMPILDSDNDGFADGWAAVNPSAETVVTFESVPTFSNNLFFSSRQKVVTGPVMTASRGIHTLTSLPSGNCGISVFVSVDTPTNLTVQCQSFTATTVLVDPSDGIVNIDNFITPTTLTMDNLASIKVTTPDTNKTFYVYMMQNVPGITTYQGVRPNSWNRGGLVGTQTFEVQRSRDYGITWEPVYRTVPHDVANDYMPNNQYIQTFDFEAPRGITLLYRARTVTVNSGVTSVSQWSVQTSVTMLVIVQEAAWRFKAVNDPVEVGFADTPKGPTWKRRSTEDASFYNPIGRTRSVKVSDVIRGEEFEFTFMCTTNELYEKVTALRDANGNNGSGNGKSIILVQAPDGRQWYTNIKQNKDVHEEFISINGEDPYWEVTLGFEETNAVPS